MRNEKLGLFTEEEMLQIREESDNALYGNWTAEALEKLGKGLIGIGTGGLICSAGAIPIVF